MAELKIDITEGQIVNAIAVALAESFSPERKDAIIRDIVRAHLMTKDRDYDKETLLHKAVNAQIRQIASEKITAMLLEMRPDIEKVVEKTLGVGFKENILNQLAYSLSHKIVSRVDVNVELEEESGQSD